jgi:hypothetical protein
MFVKKLFTRVFQARNALKIAPSVVNFNAAIFNRHQAQLCFCTDTAVENVFDVELFNPLHIMLLYFP